MGQEKGEREGGARGREGGGERVVAVLVRYM